MTPHRGYCRWQVGRSADRPETIAGTGAYEPHQTDGMFPDDAKGQDRRSSAVSPPTDGGRDLRLGIAIAGPRIRPLPRAEDVMARLGESAPFRAHRREIFNPLKA